MKDSYLPCRSNGPHNQVWINSSLILKKSCGKKLSNTILVCKFATKYLPNPYGIYTPIISTTLLWKIYGIPMVSTHLWHLQLCYKIFMQSTTLYEHYGLYQNSQGLLMRQQHACTPAQTYKVTTIFQKRELCISNTFIPTPTPSQPLQVPSLETQGGGEFSFILSLHLPLTVPSLAQNTRQRGLLHLFILFYCTMTTNTPPLFKIQDRGACFLF